MSVGALLPLVLCVFSSVGSEYVNHSKGDSTYVPSATFTGCFLSDSDAHVGVFKHSPTVSHSLHRDARWPACGGGLFYWRK